MAAVLSVPQIPVVYANYWHVVATRKKRFHGAVLMKLSLLLIPFALYGQQTVSDQQAAINQQLQAMLARMHRDGIEATIALAAMFALSVIFLWRRG